MKKWCGMNVVLGMFVIALTACTGKSTQEAETELANRALTEKVYADFAAGDIDAVFAAMTDEIVWNEAENFPYADGNPYVGRESVGEGVFARLGAEWDYWNLDVTDYLPSGDRVVAIGRYNATHSKTGKTISAQFVHVWTIADGRLAEFQQYADTAQVNAAMESN